MRAEGRAIGVTASLILLIVILFPSRTTGTPQRADLYFSSWIAPDDEIAFLLHSAHGPGAALPKLFQQKASVWRISNKLPVLGKLLGLILENRLFNVKTVVFASASGSNLKTLLQRRIYTPSSRILTHWVLLVDEQTYESIKSFKLHVPSYASVCELEADGKGTPMIARCLPKREDESPGLQTSRYLAQHMKDIARVEAFSGENLVLGCVLNIVDDSCNTAYNIGIRNLLSRKNATIRLFRYGSYRAIYTDFLKGRIDIILANVEFVDRTLWSFSFAAVDFNYKTFYALANSTRVLSMIEAMASSSCVVLALSCLFLCALTIAATRGALGTINFVFIVSEEALFLLASLLGTSSPEARLRRKVNVGYSLYALWLGGIFLFSVYLRSEFTSMVTVVRPSDHTDTLSELETALDDDKVRVCVAELSSAISYLQRQTSSSGIFVEKLKASYLRHHNEGIVTKSDIDCLRCALGKNHVCFTSRHPFCMVKKRFPDLGVFKEHLNAEVVAFPLQKEFTLMRPFQRFMRSIREGHLIKDNFADCDTEPLSSRSTLELWSFFRHFFVLHSLAILAFVGEILFGRFFETGPSDTRLD